MGEKLSYPVPRLCCIYMKSRMLLNRKYLHVIYLTSDGRVKLKFFPFTDQVNLFPTAHVLSKESCELT